MDGQVYVGTVVISSNALVREGLVRMLESRGFHVLASAATLDQVQSLPRRVLSLLVIDTGDDSDGAIGQIEYFRKRNASGRIVVLGRRNQMEEMVSAYRAGANAYFVKIPKPDAIIKSLDLVLDGLTIVPQEFFSGHPAPNNVVQLNDSMCGTDAFAHLFEGDGEDIEQDLVDEDRVASISREAQTNSAVPTRTGSPPHLSARQKLILGCLLDGASNKAIARRMAIAEATVKVHVKAILRKIRVRNRTQAAVWAMSHGQLVTPELAYATTSTPGAPPIAVSKASTGRLSAKLVAFGDVED
jgi:two-component system nitrate/nitrite response regulator NarL